MNFFKQHIRPALIGLIVMAIPILLIAVIANLPPSDPQLPDYYTAQGYSAVRGEQLEKLIATSTNLTASEFAVACPDILVVSTTESGLCGYCKLTDMQVYPFWQSGFTAKLRPTRYDYRAFYFDHLHRRYVSLTHGDYAVFSASASQGQWQEGYGRWFMCKNADFLDINAYVKVIRDYSAKNNLHVRVAVGDYRPLTPVYDQVQVAKPKATPAPSH